MPKTRNFILLLLSSLALANAASGGVDWAPTWDLNDGAQRVDPKWASKFHDIFGNDFDVGDMLNMGASQPNDTLPVGGPAKIAEEQPETGAPIAKTDGTPPPVAERGEYATTVKATPSVFSSRQQAPPIRQKYDEAREEYDFKKYESDIKNYDEGREEYEYKKYDSELKKLQKTIEAMRQEAVASNERSQAAADAAQRLAEATQRHTEELARVTQQLRLAEQRAQQERQQSQKLLARLEKIELQQGSLVAEYAAHQKEEQPEPEPVAPSVAVAAPTLRLSDAEAKLVDDHRQQQVGQLEARVQDLQATLETSEQARSSEAAQHASALEAARTENSRLAAELQARDVQLERAAAERQAFEEQAEASLAKEIAAGVRRDELEHTTQSQAAALAEIQSEHAALTQRAAQFEDAAREHQAMRDSIDHQREQAEQLSQQLNKQLQDSQLREAELAERAEKQVQELAARLRESELQKVKIAEREASAQKALSAEREAANESKHQFADAQREAQERRDNLAEAKVQMQRLIAENTQLRSQHEQIQRALAGLASPTTPAEIRQQAVSPTEETPVTIETVPVSPARADEASVEPLVEDLPTPAYYEEEPEQPASEEPKHTMFAEPESDTEAPPAIELTQEAGVAADDHIALPADVEVETSDAAAELVESPVPEAHQEAPEDMAQPTQDAPKEINQETERTITAETPQEIPQETHQDSTSQEARHESTHEVPHDTKSDEPAKLGAGFGPHGTSRRAYMFMLLQAALAVLTLGILTGGCRVTVQQGTAQQISNLGGTRFSLTM